MERLSLKSLSTVYDLQSRYVVETEENYCSVYSCAYHLDASYESESDRYIFKISRSGMQIDGKPVGKLMDKIMLEIGNSIYPLALSVSPQMKIEDVMNYAEVKQRWTECTKEQLENHPSAEMERYVDRSRRNMSDINSFIDSLRADTFFNVYFRNIYVPTPRGEANLIQWSNFPRREMNQTYLYRVGLAEENRIDVSGQIMQIVPEQNGSYTMSYEVGAMGEIIDITGSVESRYQGRLYQKCISIKVEPKI